MTLEKPLTIKSWSRRGGECPMGSSLPNHDAKDWKGQTEKRHTHTHTHTHKNTKGRLHQTQLEHKKIKIKKNNLNDA